MADPPGSDFGTLPGMTMLKVSSPAELISAVPFLIGFHPADSLTVVAMRAHQIAFAVRIDLPELGTPDDEVHAAVLHLASVVTQQEVQAVTIIGYGEAARVTPAVLRLSEAFRRIGLNILDELRVAGGRFWSYLCTDLSCCPAVGQPCDPANSVVAAEATFAGAVALPNREALAAQVAPTTGDDREAMLAATARAGIRLAALAGVGPRPATPSVDGQPGEGRRVDPDISGLRSVRLSVISDEPRFFRQVRRAGRAAVREAERCYRSGRRLTDDDVAWLGVMLLHLPVRDYAWTRTRKEEWEVALWSDVLRRVEPRYAPAPASLLAFVAWRSGSGALASVAVERALEQQADYSLAVLLHEVLLFGLPPSVLDGWPAIAVAPAMNDGPAGAAGPAMIDLSELVCGHGPTAEPAEFGKVGATGGAGLKGGPAASAGPAAASGPASAGPTASAGSAAASELAGAGPAAASGPAENGRPAAEGLDPPAVTVHGFDRARSSSRPEAPAESHPRRPEDGRSPGRKERPRRTSRRRI